MHIPQIQKTKRIIKKNEETEMLLVGILLCGDGHKLLGGLGNVISTLDDLLGDQLHVRRRAALRRQRLPALALKPERTGGQQAQRASNSLRARLLWEEGSHFFHSHMYSF